MKLVPLAVAAALGLAATSSAAATKTAKLQNNAFSPSNMTVKKGTKVVWRFADRVSHNVVVTRGPVKFRSPTKSSGTYSRTLSKAGTYQIVCTLHPGMRQTIRVR